MAHPSSPPAALVRAFVAYLGGASRHYTTHLPPHLFPQWSTDAAAQTLIGLGYPLSRVINLGCSFEVHEPLPANEPLTVRARIPRIDDDDRRLIVHSRLVTTTPSAPRGLIAETVSMFPLRSRVATRTTATHGPSSANEGSKPAGKASTHIRLGRGAGLDFAKLTGDFNPIHWSSAAGRAAGFQGPVLQGFGTVAHAVQATARMWLGGDANRLARWSCRLTAPVLLPGELAVFTEPGEVTVHDPRTNRTLLSGQFETRR